MDPFTTDVLAEILERLPPNARRRSRLVCRRWRDVVDKRTETDLRSRATTLLVAAGGSAHVLGGDSRWKPRKVLASAEERTMSVVGTCNGLICLCDVSKPPGALALANPATGERLVLPPLPCAEIIISTHKLCHVMHPSWHAVYGFAHHQATGKYKVVHLPCSFDRIYEFDTIQVFTLGEAAWRDVPTPTFGGVGARCRFDIGVANVDGVTYWVAEDTGKIISFDLRDEHVTSVKPLPMAAVRPLEPEYDRFRLRLTEVHWRVGMAVLQGSWSTVHKTAVWVLESARGKQTWALWYTIETSKMKKEILLPHFAHGEHVLCVNDHQHLFAHQRTLLRVPANKKRTTLHAMFEVGGRDGATVVDMARKVYVRRAFAHVETKEPLGIYRLW